MELTGFHYRFLNTRWICMDSFQIKKSPKKCSDWRLGGSLFMALCATGGFHFNFILKVSLSVTLKYLSFLFNSFKAVSMQIGFKRSKSLLEKLRWFLRTSFFARLRLGCLIVDFEKFFAFPAVVNRKWGQMVVLC